MIFISCPYLQLAFSAIVKCMNTAMIPDIYFTREGYDNLISERDNLIKDRKTAVEHLQKAREMGDLSENGYYKASKAKLGSIDYRLRKINYFLRYGKIRALPGSGRIDIGSRVTISSINKSGNEGTSVKTFRIVGNHEADPEKEKISYLSPLGKELIGKRSGEIISVNTPKGEICYKIDQVF